MGTADNIVINRILTQAAERGSSDVHLTVGSQPVFRINGELVSQTAEAVMTPEIMNQIVDFFLSPEKKTLLDSNKSVTVGYNFGNRVRFRLHIDIQKGQPAIDMRVIPLVVPSVTKLNLSKKIVEATTRKKGLIIISGPFNSGRSTTMAALIDNINHTKPRHIVTIEDPINFLLSSDKALIKQRDLGDDVPSLEIALDDVASEDVEVLAIDVTVPASLWMKVLKLASSGTLVIVTMAAENTVSALEYLVNSASAHTDTKTFTNMLAEVLLVASCQRLVPRLGGGRLIVSELLFTSSAVESLLREGKVSAIQNVLDTSRAEGMVSLERALADLVKIGEVQPENALAQASNQESLKSMLRLRS